ncbi:hypothetical protein ACPV5U_28430, partial [Vibrio mediterranei]
MFRRLLIALMLSNAPMVCAFSFCYRVGMYHACITVAVTWIMGWLFIIDGLPSGEGRANLKRPTGMW